MVRRRQSDLIGTDTKRLSIDDDASVNVADADVIHSFTAGSGSNDRIQIGDGTGGQSVILRQKPAMWSSITTAMAMAPLTAMKGRWPC